MSDAAPVAQELGRLHRVSLCVMVFSDIEVRAESVSEAFAKAEAEIERATVRFRADPVATRAEVMLPVDYREPAKGMHWVELVREFANGRDGEAGFHWVAKVDRR